MTVDPTAGLGGAGYASFVPTQFAGSPSAASATGSTAGADFGRLVADGIERLDTTNHAVDQLAVKAATGDLENIHDYTLAASQAQVTTQMTVALRNKAVEAFTEIMRMNV
jgi:flagellar hook-basal body complex protein FliE